MGAVTQHTEQTGTELSDPPASRHWLRWSRADAAGLLVLSLLFVFFTFRGTNPEKSTFYDLNPRPDSVEYTVEASRIYHGLGADLVVNGNRFPSRYPLGFPLALAALHPLFGGSTKLVVIWAPILFTLASLWVFFTLIRHCAGPVAAWSGTILYATNPCVLILSKGVYSETLLALFTILTVGFFLQSLERGDFRSSLLFGICYGFSLLVRIQVIITAPVLLVGYLYLTRRRFDIRPLLYAVCGAAPFLLVQAIFQWDQFGSPLITGYSYHLKGLTLFSKAYLAGGLKFYVPALFLGRNTACATYIWVFVPLILPVLTIAGMTYACIRGAHRAVVVSLVFTAITFFFFCCYLFTDVRFFLQVLLLFFAWSGVGIAWIAGRPCKSWKLLIPAAIVLIALFVPVGNRATPALFAETLRTTPQISYCYLDAREIYNTIRKDAPSPPVLVTSENLAMLNFYSDEFVLYPLAKTQEYVRVSQIGRLFPETIDSLLKKNTPVYVTDLNAQGKWDLKALTELKEDFELQNLPCHLYGDFHLYKVIARKQSVPGRSYWGGDFSAN